MNIVEFEKEVMFLFREHYKGTDKINAVNWFEIKLSSFYKNKVIQVIVLGDGDPREDDTINGKAITYDELFINTLFLIRDYLLKAKN